MLPEATNPGAVFDKEFSFGELIHSRGCCAGESPNYKILEQKTKPLGNIWKDAVEYSCCNRSERHLLFDVFDCVPSVESSLVFCDSFGQYKSSDPDSMLDSSTSSSCTSSLADYPVSSKNCQLNDSKLVVHNSWDDGETNSDINSERSQKHDGNDLHNSSISLNEKRRRNNQACKKFRKAKKTRHQQLYLRAEQLQKENNILRSRIHELEKEIEKWKEFFEGHPNYLQP